MPSETDNQPSSLHYRIIDLGQPRALAIIPSQDTRSARRTRVTLTDVQRARVEEVFSANELPSPALKQQLAEEQGLTFSQVENWFRNRRQKSRATAGLVVSRSRSDRDGDAPRTFARTLEPSLGSHVPGPSSTSETSSPWTTVPLVPATSTYTATHRGFESHNHIAGQGANVLRERDDVIINFHSLAIGTWQRFSGSPSVTILQAWLSSSRQRFAWYIRGIEGGEEYMMDIPLNSMTSAENRPHNSNPRLGAGSVELSRPPQFFVRPSQTLVQGHKHDWKPCKDWTGGQPGVAVLRHQIQGPVESVQYIITFLNNNISQDDRLPFQTLRQPRGERIPESSAGFQTFPVSNREGFGYQDPREAPTLQSTDVSQPLDGRRTSYTRSSRQCDTSNPDNAPGIAPFSYPTHSLPTLAADSWGQANTSRPLRTFSSHSGVSHMTPPHGEFAGQLWPPSSSRSHRPSHHRVETSPSSATSLSAGQFYPHAGYPPHTASGLPGNRALSLSYGQGQKAPDGRLDLHTRTTWSAGRAHWVPDSLNPVPLSGPSRIDEGTGSLSSVSAHGSPSESFLESPSESGASGFR